MAKCNQVTEVYSRVVGYHRPVKNWNKGKQSEFADRIEYGVPSASQTAAATACCGGTCGDKARVA